jgi:hypothetical protein
MYLKQVYTLFNVVYNEVIETENACFESTIFHKIGEFDTIEEAENYIYRIDQTLNYRIMPIIKALR